MNKRIDFNLVKPAAYEAMDALDQFVNKSSVNSVIREFIRIRASQINGCAYCVDAHSADARKLGESEQRIFLVNAWREADSIFSEEERVVLEMTEEITLIHRRGLSDDLYEKAIKLFGEEKTAELIMAIITINAWNRIGVATKLRPRLRKKPLAETHQFDNG
jgi:AhpD family alkylhydroperoxidase